MSADSDARWLAAAASLAERARPLSWPNPAVGALLVKNGIVVGQGWTQPGGRPHAEAMALRQAGEAARGSTLYVTLEPCAHESTRGPACADLAAAADLARVVVGIEDPDPRTAGQGIGRLRDAGVEVRCADDPRCHLSLRGYVRAKTTGLPEITLKLALTADGFIARKDGTSKWITGEAARAHAHRERARAEAILVGGGTLRADNPTLDVRLPGLESRSPKRFLLTRGEAPAGWDAVTSPADIRGRGLQHLLVEGGAQTAASFLAEENLVDRLLVYRAPVEFGEGIPAFGDAEPDGVPAGWHLVDRRAFAPDTLEIYERER